MLAKSNCFFAIGGVIKKVSLFFYIFFCCGLITLPYAALSAPEISYSGFATIGLAYNDSDNLGYRNTLKLESLEDWGINADSLLGLQVNIDFDNNFDAVIQAVFKDRVSDRDADNIEWAFLRYRLNREFALRAGRINTDLYLLSEYKNVRYSYLWARPPSELYNLVSTVSSIDGIEGRLSTNVGSGFVELSLAVGETSQILNDGTETVKVDLNSIIASSVSYSQDNWMARASLLRTTVDEVSSQINLLVDALALAPPEIWPQASYLSEHLDPDGTEISYAGLGYQYEDNRFIFISELGYTNSEWGALPQETYNAYLSLGVIQGAVTYYVSLAGATTHQDPVQIDPPVIMTPDLAELVYASEVNQSKIEQQTFSAGMKWSFHNNMNLNLQWDRTNVDKGADLLWTHVEPIEQREKVNLFSVGINLVF